MQDSKFIKKIISAKGQEMYYVGDGQWFGRISKTEALEGLQSKEYQLWSVINKLDNTELFDVKLDINGQIITEIVVDEAISNTELVAVVSDLTVESSVEIIEDELVENLEARCNRLAHNNDHGIFLRVLTNDYSKDVQDRNMLFNPVKCVDYKNKSHDLYCLQRELGLTGSLLKYRQTGGIVDCKPIQERLDLIQECIELLKN